MSVRHGGAVGDGRGGGALIFSFLFISLNYIFYVLFVNPSRAITDLDAFLLLYEGGAGALHADLRAYFRAADAHVDLAAAYGSAH